MLLSFFLAAYAAVSPGDFIGAELKRVPLDRLAERSKLYFFLGRLTGQTEHYEQALDLATKGRALHPADPGSILWWIAAKGEVVLRKEGKLASLPWIKTFEEQLLTLREKHPTFDHFAADRVLGHLYSKAPALISIGSNAKARFHLRKAFEGAPGFPGNQIAYAEFLKDRGESEAAHALAETALKNPDLDQYPLERQTWLEEAAAIAEATRPRRFIIPFGKPRS